MRSVPTTRPWSATIILVDDSATNRALYTKLARNLQSAVRTISFPGPLEALDWLNDNTVDLIVTDFKMPGIDGAEFIRRVRLLPQADDEPIIVVTAYQDRSFRVTALEAGATDFLLSPVDHVEFAARARNLLKLREHQRAVKERLKCTEMAHRALIRDSRESLVQVIDQVPALISAVDRSGSFVFVNEALRRFAQSSGEAASNAPSTLGRLEDESALALTRLVFETGVPMAAREEVIARPDGEKHTFLTTRTPLRDSENRVVSVLTTSLDISDRKRAEERLNHLAKHDSLTDLPNRTLLQTVLQQLLARGRRGDGRFALLFIDLDRFKAINDGLGHPIGDELLVAVARRLRQALRDVDTIARLGGDEFAVVQREIGSEADAAMLADRIICCLSVPFLCRGHELTIGASVGIALCPRDGTDAETLLRNADLAMYRAKATGRNTWRHFCPGMAPNAREAVELESDLRVGLSHDEFRLYYQPQVDLKTGRIVGVEALLRWHRCGREWLTPDRFLGLAEETGLIMPISAWMLREACQQAVQWRHAGLPSLRISVNVSPLQFQRQSFLELVVETLNTTGLNASALELEMTESILINSEEATSTLQRVRALGTTVAIDDFGTGYSSLAYLKRFKIDRLKIDQSFTKGIMVDPSDTAIVRTIIDIGRTLNLDLIAEGIETAQQRDFLAVEGCGEGQGFLFSQPVAPNEIVRMLENNHANPSQLLSQSLRETGSPENPAPPLRHLNSQHALHS